jgi:hypothetical protein
VGVRGGWNGCPMDSHLLLGDTAAVVVAISFAHDGQRTSAYGNSSSLKWIKWFRFLDGGTPRLKAVGDCGKRRP